MSEATVESPLRTISSFVRQMFGENPQRFKAELRMSKDCFIGLCQELTKKNRLQEGPEFDAKEQLALFLYSMGHVNGIQLAQDRFGIAREVFDECFLRVITALCQIRRKYIKRNDPCGKPAFKYDRRFYPYFKDCIGAIGGTHIPAMVEQQKCLFLNHKGVLSQNVMAAINFDHTFSYLVTGWSGSVCDAVMLKDAVESGQPNVPEGKYYIVDSENANSEKFIAPYRGHRNHISEYEFFECDYSGPIDIFNHRHAQLMTVVHKAFHNLRTLFPVLNSALSCPLPSQGKLVRATCVIYNYIYTKRDPLFLLHQGVDGYMDYASSNDEEEPEEVGGRDRRSYIADHLWSEF